MIKKSVSIVILHMVELMRCLKFQLKTEGKLEISLMHDFFLWLTPRRCMGFGWDNFCVNAIQGKRGERSEFNQPPEFVMKMGELNIRTSFY